MTTPSNIFRVEVRKKFRLPKKKKNEKKLQTIFFTHDKKKRIFDFFFVLYEPQKKYEYPENICSFFVFSIITNNIEISYFFCCYLGKILFCFFLSVKLNKKNRNYVQILIQVDKKTFFIYLDRKSKRIFNTRGPKNRKKKKKHNGNIDFIGRVFFFVCLFILHQISLLFFLQ